MEDIIKAVQDEVKDPTARVFPDENGTWTADCEKSRGLSYAGTWSRYGNSILIVVTNEG
jgi:hypothetical protein